MAERIVSPGVFTREKDESFLSAGVAEIGPAVIGPTVKGPAQLPTLIRSINDYETIFGGYTNDSYVPIAINNWYKEGGGPLTVTRLLYENGYTLKNGALGIIATSGSASYVTHLLHPDITVTQDGTANELFENSILLNDESGSFAIKISGSFTPNATIPGFDGDYRSTGFISASIKSAGNGGIVDNVASVFSTSPKDINYPVYIQYNNFNAESLFSNMGKVTMSLAIVDNYAYATDYNEATTPWITSQKVGLYTNNLFRFHTISHGTPENHDVKVEIKNILLGAETSDPDQWPTFDVVVRRVNQNNIENKVFINEPGAQDETDINQTRLITFTGVNLNPLSPNYICKKIGTQYKTSDSSGRVYNNGDYPRTQDYIRVEVKLAVEESTIDKNLMPFGFESPLSPIADVSSSAGNLNLAAVSYVTAQNSSVGYDASVDFGFDYYNLNNLNYLAPLPSSGSNTGSNADFYLGDMSQSMYATADPYATSSLQSYLVAGTFAAEVDLETRKFMTMFQGGYDGAKPNLSKFSGEDIIATNTFGFDCSGASTTGTEAYKKAFAALGNTDAYDINMLLTPGILNTIHGSVTSRAMQLAKDRQDTFYIMDTGEYKDTINTIVSSVNTIDSNYTATYYPWVKINQNDAGGVAKWTPPSVIILGAIAKNDVLQSPWYAPAGLNRGGLTAVTDTTINLSQADRDTLYLARVNPIANFPNSGIVIWGQKTLQARPSALDRVNVRRLLITVKKFIASATKYLVFEQNTTQTRNKFLSIANPYLESIKNSQGLSAFRVVMDASNNTPDIIDQNILYGQIFLQPTRTAEFIILDFNIQSTGAAFPE